MCMCVEKCCGKLTNSLLILEWLIIIILVNNIKLPNQQIIIILNLLLIK